MAILKKKIRNILGIISISTLLIGVALGILVRENNSKNTAQQSAIQGKQDYHFKNQGTEGKKLICSQLLEETLEKDGNVFAFEEYTNAEIVECMSVGCGGFF